MKKGPRDLVCSATHRSQVVVFIVTIGYEFYHIYKRRRFFSTGSKFLLFRRLMPERVPRLAELPQFVDTRALTNMLHYSGSHLASNNFTAWARRRIRKRLVTLSTCPLLRWLKIILLPYLFNHRFHRVPFASLRVIAMRWMGHLCFAENTMSFAKIQRVSCYTSNAQVLLRKLLTHTCDPILGVSYTKYVHKSCSPITWGHYGGFTHRHPKVHQLDVNRSGTCSLRSDPAPGFRGIANAPGANEDAREPA